MLQKQQLLLYGRVARLNDGDLMRDVTFCPGSLNPAVDRFVRKVGRPRLAWTSLVGKLALEAAGGLQRLEDTIFDSRSWQSVVEAFL